MKKLTNLTDKNFSQIKEMTMHFAINLGLAIIIFIIGFWIAKMLSKLIRKLLTKSGTDAGLITFLTSLTSILIKILTIVTGISKLGFEMTSFAALLGAAGLAIGLAFSGTLSNFAGGVMILIFKPFKIGDSVKIMNEAGVVKEIQIFNTILFTADNKVIVLPNGPVANGIITNNTRQDLRRVDIHFGISPNENILKIREILQEIASKNTLLNTEKVTFIGFGELKENAIQVHFNIWTNTENYQTVYYQTYEAIYTKFNELGINFGGSETEKKMENIVVQNTTLPK